MRWLVWVSIAVLMVVGNVNFIVTKQSPITSCTELPVFVSNERNGMAQTFQALLVSPRSNRDTTISGFYDAGDGGGGVFYWDSTKQKSQHDGGTVIDPATTISPGDPGWWSTTSSSGTGVWCRQSLDSPSFKWFGAKGNGRHNDTDAIQAALLYAAGGEIIYGGASDIYIVTESYSGIGANNATWYGALSVYSGTKHYGNGATLKMMNNTSTADSPRDVSIFLISKNEMEVKDVEFHDVVFDLNGANNLIGKHHTGRKNFAALFTTGDDVTFSNGGFYGCIFKNSPGKTALGLGQTNNHTTTTKISSNIQIKNCTFENNGTDTDDHSSLYGWCEDLFVSGCVFSLAVDYTKWVHSAAMEIHGARSIVTGNIVKGFYSKAAFIASNYVNDVENILVNNNIFSTYRSGLVFFISNDNFKILRDVTISDNTFIISDKVDSTPLKAGVKINPPYGCSDILIDSNVFRKIGNEKPFYGIYIANGTAPNPIDSISMTRNVILNATKGIYAVVSKQDSLGNLDIINNIIDIAVQSDNNELGVGVHVRGKKGYPIKYVDVSNNIIVTGSGCKNTGVGINLSNISTIKVDGNVIKGVTIPFKIKSSTIRQLYGKQALMHKSI